MSAAAPGREFIRATNMGAGAGSVPIVRQAPSTAPYRLTVEQVEAMVRAGILGEDDRCELIRGELIKKMVLGDAHVATVRWLNRWFSRVAQDRFIVGVQDTIKLTDSIPELDLTLLKPRADFYSQQTALAADVLLLIEVADSSLDYDRTIKLPLYAENGIEEYWIVNLADSCIEIHRQPRAEGTYAQRLVAGRNEGASPAALPDLALSVDELFRPHSGN